MGTQALDKNVSPFHEMWGTLGECQTSDNKWGRSCVVHR